MSVERPFNHAPVRGRHGAAAGDPRGPDVAAARTAVPKHIEATSSETKAGSLTWLLAAMGWPDIAGDVLAYGTVIATGNAVVEWVPHDVEPVPAALVPAHAAPAGRRPGAELGASWRRPPAPSATACAPRASRPCCCSRPSGSPCSATRCSATPRLRGTPDRRELVPLRLRPPRHDLARRHRARPRLGRRDRRRRACRPAARSTRASPSTPARSSRRGCSTRTATAAGPWSRATSTPTRRRWPTVAAAGVRGGAATWAAARRGRGQRAVLRADPALDHPRRGPRRRRPRPLEPQGPRRDPAPATATRSLALSPQYARRRRPTASSGRTRSSTGCRGGRRPGRGAGLRPGLGHGGGGRVVGPQPRRSPDGQSSGVHRGRGLRAGLRRGRRDGEGDRGRGPRGRCGSAAGSSPWP